MTCGAGRHGLSRGKVLTVAVIVPKTTIEEVRARSDIVDVLGRYLRLERAGSNFRALCPFHREKTPSFNVSPERQGFHCFGCGKGGDVFRFLMEYENVDFPAALRMLADWAGITLPHEKQSAAERSGPRKDTLFRLHDELARWYHECLMRHPAAKPARDYLAGRDIHSDAAADFMIGYADADANSVLRWGEQRRFSREELFAAGVIAQRERDKRWYGRFRDRLMFPIRDEQKRVIAFSGRAMREGERIAKYVNSPETVLFQKKRVLFGFDRARRTIIETREALVCEGQIDVIRCHLAGFANTVAAQGTAFSEEHALKLARAADGVLLVFDADDAGREAAFKTAITCLQCALSVRVVPLPAGEDPDSLIRAGGREAFEKILAKAQDVMDFRLDHLLQRENAATEIGMRAVTRGIEDLVLASRDPLQHERMVQHAAQRLVVDPAVLHRVFTPRAERSRPATRSAQAAAPPNPAANRPIEEWALVEHLAAAPELADLVRQHLPLQRMRDADCRRVLETILAATQAGETDLLGYCAGLDNTNGDLQQLLSAAIMAPQRIMGREFDHQDAVKDLILKIWRENLRRRLQTLLRGGRKDEDASFRMECAQLRTDIKRLDNWESGVTIIDMLVNEESPVEG